MRKCGVGYNAKGYRTGDEAGAGRPQCNAEATNFSLASGASRHKNPWEGERDRDRGQTHT